MRWLVLATLLFSLTVNAAGLAGLDKMFKPQPKQPQPVPQPPKPPIKK